jgi:O-antigen/teichoic acid export membrane protein
MSSLARHGRNFSWLLFAEVIQKTLSFVLFIYVSRELTTAGNSAYGVFTTAFPFFVTLTSMGFFDVIVRDIAKDATKKNVLIFTALVGQALIFIPTMLVLWIGLRYTSYSEMLKVVLIAGLAGATLHTMTRTHYAMLAASEQFKWLSWLNIWLRILVVSCSLVVLFYGGGAAELVIVFIPIYVVQVLAARLVARVKCGPYPLKLHAESLKYLFMQGFPIALGGIVATVYFAVDLLMLEGFGHTQLAGFYSIGIRFMLLMLTFSDLLASMLFPVYSRSALGPRAIAQSVLEKGIKASILFALPSAIAVSLLTDDIVILVAGSSNLPSVPSVAIFTWVFLFEMINRNFIDFLRAFGKQNLPLYIYGTAFVIKLIAALGLFRFYHDPLFALLELNLILGALMTIALAIATARAIRGISILNIIDRSVLRPLFASIVMGAVLGFITSYPLYVTAPTGFFVYCTAAWLSGAIGEFEKDLVRKTFGI